MAKTRQWLVKLCALGLVFSACVFSAASVQDATILIDRALNSPTLTVRYSGAHVAMVELRVNGGSFGTRSTDPSANRGETNFSLKLSELQNGDNDVEVRLYDKNGKLVGVERSNVSTDDATKAPVYLIMPKAGSTVQGPVQVSVGFGRDLHNTYVSFFIDNQFKSMTNSPPFNFMWDTARDANGWHEVEAWVVDDSSTTYKTKRAKVYVNNPGGRTNRVMPPVAEAPKGIAPTPPVAKVLTTAPVAVSHVALTAIHPTAKVDLGSVASGTRAVSPGVVAIAQRGVTALVPHSVASVPRLSNASTMSGAEVPELGSTAGTKTVELAPTLSTGAQLLIPTGKRVAIPKVSPVAASTTTKVPLKPRVSKGNHPALPVLPKPVAVAAATTVAKAPTPVHGPIAARTPTPAVKAVPVVAVANPVKRVAVAHGTKLPNIGKFAITMDAKPVNFDAVKPRVQNGVPLTPFRYLFEQSGGKVGWTNTTKTVNANGHGREIYIKIGEKLAKVNSLPIEMDLAPFIENGRTVVPLSFLTDALDIQVDYDPITGHVLITSIKKKK